MQIRKTAVLKHLGFGRENEDKVPVADRGEKRPFCEPFTDHLRGWSCV